MIFVDGKRYKVTEDLGFQPSSGHYAKMVETSDGERVVVKEGGLWRFWTGQDTLGGYRVKEKEG